MHRDHHRPQDYAELVLHTPLLFEQQTLIRCEQGDEEIYRLCREAAWSGEPGSSDNRDSDDFEDVVDRCAIYSAVVLVALFKTCLSRCRCTLTLCTVWSVLPGPIHAAGGLGPLQTSRLPSSVEGCLGRAS